MLPVCDGAHVGHRVEKPNGACVVDDMLAIVENIECCRCAIDYMLAILEYAECRCDIDHMLAIGSTQNDVGVLSTTCWPSPTKHSVAGVLVLLPDLVLTVSTG